MTDETHGPVETGSTVGDAWTRASGEQDVKTRAEWDLLHDTLEKLTYAALHRTSLDYTVPNAHSDDDLELADEQLFTAANAYVNARRQLSR